MRLLLVRSAAERKPDWKPGSFQRHLYSFYLEDNKSVFYVVIKLVT